MRPKQPERGQPAAAPVVQALRIEHEVEIAAPATRVFDALTKDIAAWWGAPYLLGDKPKDIVLEARVGGRLYEVWDDESGSGHEGALWATVTSVHRPERLDLTGAMGMFGAIHGVTTFELKDMGTTTLVKLTHAAFGAFRYPLEEMESSYTAGWRDLIGVRLKAFIETGKRYGLGCEPPPRRSPTR